MGIYKLSMQELSAIIQSPTSNLRDVWILRFTNGLTLFGTFFASSFIFSRVAKFHFGMQASLVQETKKSIHIPLLVFLSITCFMSVLLLEILVQNMGTPAGKFGDYLRETQAQRNQMDTIMLTMHNSRDMIFTLFFIGIIPAVCEEVFFRGILQRLLIGWTKKPHLAIFIQALVFSLMHFNYIGTIPILFIAMLFGYIVYITGNLWYSIAMHFVNNGALVCLIYFNYSPENWPQSIILSIGIPSFIVLIFVVLKKYKNRVAFIPFFAKSDITQNTYENE